MPKRKHIALVACEACRKRKSRCDGNSPVCAPCQTKRTRCAYPSEPNVSRFASLKSDYEHLKLNHAKLSAIYDRLKNGSASEATRLLECIRKEDEIPSLSGTKDSPPRPFNDHQPTDHDEKPAEEIEWRRPVSSAWSGGQTSLELEPASDLCAMPHGIGPADTIFNVESEKQSSFSLSPRALLRNSKFDGVQTSENIQQGPRPHISVSHKVLLWPRIVSHVTQSGHAAAAGPDLQYLVRHGSPWLLQRETSKHRSDLPCNVGLPSSTLRDGTVFFPGLTIRRVNEYSSAYFNTFNMLLPLLDLDLFMDSIVTRVLREGYRNDDLESVVALLVFALGQLAIEGVTGRPAGGSKDEASGFRGGTIEKPPGLGLFNEARRRIGMINMQPCLENVQILLLQAIYFESSARHTSFWSSISAASLACTCLIRSEQIDWTSVYGDLVKRAFWVCVLQERLFHLEFRVISTGIESLEDDIPLPHFQGAVRRERLPSGPLSDAPRDVAADKPEHFHFVAMITLSRLIRRANNMIHGYEPGLGENEPLWQGSDMPTLADASTYLLPAEGYEGPPSAVVSELFRQLECWRDALPQWLQWRDDDRFDFGGIQPLGTALYASFFSPLRNLGPGQLDHNVDVAVAQLRTRFYHARFLICRPFIYKALHFPDLMTADDRIKCAFAIDAACLWPLSLAPPKNKKHLIPQLFSWTQNFLAMILVLRTSRSSKYLNHICKENSIMEANIESAIDSMIRWLEDVRQVDGIADWSLRVLGPSFS